MSELYKLRDCMVESGRIMALDEHNRRYEIARALNSWRNVYEHERQVLMAEIETLEARLDQGIDKLIESNTKLVEELQRRVTSGGEE